METQPNKLQTVQKKSNVGTGYAPGKAVVVALQEAEAAFSGIQVQRTGLERALSFVCSKRGITMLVLLVALSTHLKQTKTFLNNHVFHSAKSITTASLSEESEGVELTDSSDDSAGSSLTAPLRNAKRQQKALVNHNSKTIESADTILEETN